MIEFEIPWIELAVLIPLLGALWVRGARDPDVARRQSLTICAITLACALAAWAALGMLEAHDAHDRTDFGQLASGTPLFSIDGLSAPLLPLAALLCFLIVLATPGAKIREISFPGLLISEAILLATLSCREPWGMIAMLAAGVVPPWLELRARGKSTRVFSTHMLLFITLLVAGQGTLELVGDAHHVSMFGFALLMAAVLVRSGMAPVHCWMTDLFENASYATSLIFVVPLVGAYAALRLVLPIGPEWALHVIAVASLITALYAAGMALVQREARRFFCYLFLSNASLIFVGLETPTPLGLTGALCVWISVGLSLGGFGLVLRAIEARTGPLSLAEFHGLYEHTPGLAGLFLLTGLASIGFPGTLGFVGTELLVDGVVQADPLVGIAIVLVAALNGLAVLQAYFRIFTGTRHVTTIDLRSRPAERLAVLVLSFMILGGGLYPQPGVMSRYAAATELLDFRDRNLGAQATRPQSRGRAAAWLKFIAPDWH